MMPTEVQLNVAKLSEITVCKLVLYLRYNVSPGTGTFLFITHHLQHDRILIHKDHIEDWESKIGTQY